MYSKEEASKLRQQFWITFGKYLKPIPSAEGLPINWINYKTGVKNIFFKMDAGQHRAFISIRIKHQDATTREQFFDQFLALKNIFNDTLNEEWEWDLNAVNEYGMPQAQIFKSIDGLSVFNQQNWPALISFLKRRIIALDQFWTDVKPIFEQL